MEFQVLKCPIVGKNPSTDGAVVVAIHQVPFHQQVACMEPVLIYEYKPIVHPTAPDVRDLLELLIQVCYCFHQYKMKSCLMDLHNWHYFKANSSMKIELVKSVLEEPSLTPGLPHLPVLQDHLSFAVKDVV